MIVENCTKVFPYRDMYVIVLVDMYTFIPFAHSALTRLIISRGWERRLVTYNMISSIFSMLLFPIFFFFFFSYPSRKLAWETIDFYFFITKLLLGHYKYTFFLQKIGSIQHAYTNVYRGKNRMRELSDLMVVVLLK